MPAGKHLRPYPLKDVPHSGVRGEPVCFSQFQHLFEEMLLPRVLLRWDDGCGGFLDLEIFFGSELCPVDESSFVIAADSSPQKVQIGATWSGR